MVKGRARQIKIAAIAAVCIGAIIVFLQNTETVETRFLFATIRMSRALLLILTFLMGFVVGLLSMSQQARKAKKPRTST